MVGLGTQDDLNLARAFVADTGMSTVRMLWDETFDSWGALGVVSQPAWALFAPWGELITSAYGEIDTDTVLS